MKAWRIARADGITKYGRMKCKKCRLYVEPGDFFLFRETHKGFENLHRKCTNTEADIWKDRAKELENKNKELMQLCNHTEQFQACCGKAIGLDEELEDALEKLYKQINYFEKQHIVLLCY